MEQNIAMKLAGYVAWILLYTKPPTDFTETEFT